MFDIGTILRSFIGKNRDALAETQMFQAQLLEDDDAQEIEEMHIPGVQYNPPVNSRNFIGKISSAFKFCVGIDDNVPKLTNLNPGEKINYASASGAVVCSIRYNNDGSIDIAAPGDMNLNGNLKVTGTIDATGNINSELDIIADSLLTAISALKHKHLGALDYDTSAPVTSATPAPSTPPSSNANGDIIDGGGTNISTHNHTQADDSDGDSQQPTSGPLN